jgi:biopolymer transport protein ExbB
MKQSTAKSISMITAVSIILLFAALFCIKDGAYAQAVEKSEMQKTEQTVPKDLTGDAAKVNNQGGADGEGKDIFLFDWFKRGGLFMWPILLAAALAMGLIIERFLFYKKAKLKPAVFLEEINQILEKGSIDDVIALCKEKEMVISRVLLKGLNLRKLGLDHVEKGISAAGSIEVASLEKGLSVLSAIGNIAPLIGFLGTVSGMISAFQSIAAADQVSARLVAGGIYEALITTEAGLIVAIPVLAFYNFFVHRIETFVADIERMSSEIAEKMLGENG